MTDSDSFERIRYEKPEPAIARVVLARPETRNAQDHQMLYELDRAFQQAMRDPEVKVVILAADGPHFSSGHDLMEDPGIGDHTPVVQSAGHDEGGAFSTYTGEEDYYAGLHWRWRNLAKPTIAQVQGKAIAGGMMLAMPMDLIVASDDAQFSDPTVAFGVNGVEYFMHAWDFGPRKAKEMLFMGSKLSAEECRQLGMVNQVVPRDELESFTLAMARKIATRPAIGLGLAKRAVNFSMDAQGQHQALTGALAMHHVGHGHHLEKFGFPADPSGADVVRKEAKEK